MIITLTPIRSDETLSVSVAGDVVTVNGQALDLTPLLDGATLPAEAAGCSWVVGQIERVSGELNLTLLFPHSADAPEYMRFPESINVTEDGPVPLPTMPDPEPEVPDDD